MTHRGKTSPRKQKSAMQRTRKKSRTGRMRGRGSTQRESSSPIQPSTVTGQGALSMQRTDLVW